MHIFILIIVRELNNPAQNSRKFLKTFNIDEGWLRGQFTQREKSYLSNIKADIVFQASEILFMVLSVWGKYGQMLR